MPGVLFPYSPVVPTAQLEDTNPEAVGRWSHRQGSYKVQLSGLLLGKLDSVAMVQKLVFCTKFSVRG